MQHELLVSLKLLGLSHADVRLELALHLVLLLRLSLLLLGLLL